MTRSYEPTGYCPHCGYRMDAGVCPDCGRTVQRPAKLHPRARRRRRVIRALFAITALLALGGAGVHYRDELAVRFWPTWHLRDLADGDIGLNWWAYEVLTDRLDRRLTKERPRMEDRRRRIASELDTLGPHDWAGKYVPDWLWDDELDEDVLEYLLVAPEAGFVRWSHEYDFNHGDIASVTEQRIVLRPVINPVLEACSSTETTTELVRVRWGTCRLLVPVEEMLSLCNSLNSFGCLDGYGLKRLGGAVPADGVLPEVPAEFRRFILSKPVAGTVTEVREIQTELASYEDGGSYGVEIMLDIGARDGVFEGMELWQQVDTHRSMARVSAVFETNCVARCSGLWSELFWPGPLPETGMSYCTLPPCEKPARATQPAGHHPKGELP